MTLRTITINDTGVPQYKNWNDFVNNLDKLYYYTQLMNCDIINENNYTPYQVLAMINVYLESLLAAPIAFSDKNTLIDWKLNNPEPEPKESDQLELEFLNE